MLARAFWWLGWVKADIGAVDLWQAASGGRELIDAAHATAPQANTPFEPSELDSIRRGLAEIRALLESREPSPSEVIAKQRDSRFEYLADAATRQRRVDWVNIFVGQLVDLVVNGLASSTMFGEMMRMASTFFKPLLEAATKYLSRG
jgi:hypothetical protein